MPTENEIDTIMKNINTLFEAGPSGRRAIAGLAAMVLAGVLAVSQVQWPGMSAADKAACAILLATANIFCMERAFRHSSMRIKRDIWLSIRAMRREARRSKKNMPYPGPGTPFGAACSDAAKDLCCTSFCELMACCAYLMFMPAGWFVTTAHMGLRMFEENILDLPDVKASQDNENAVALTIAIVHLILSAIFLFAMWRHSAGGTV